jgi:hypothetical protein
LLEVGFGRRYAHSGLTAGTATLTSQAVADLPPAPADRP